VTSFLEWSDKARKDREKKYKSIYGEINPKSDKRDFRLETIEELLDALNYIDWSHSKGEISLGEWKQVEVHIKLALSYITDGKKLYIKSTRKTN
jgi:hypothetical protein